MALTCFLHRGPTDTISIVITCCSTPMQCTLIAAVCADMACDQACCHSSTSMGGTPQNKEETTCGSHPTIHYSSVMPVKVWYVQVCCRTQMPWCCLWEHHCILLRIVGNCHHQLTAYASYPPLRPRNAVPGYDTVTLLNFHHQSQCNTVALRDGIGNLHCQSASLICNTLQLTQLYRYHTNDS